MHTSGIIIAVNKKCRRHLNATRKSTAANLNELVVSVKFMSIKNGDLILDSCAWGVRKDEKSSDFGWVC